MSQAGVLSSQTAYDCGLKLIIKYVRNVFPEVGRQLDTWSQSCSDPMDEVLSSQALASIASKKFHAQGGSIYALYPHADFIKSIRFITALQTISDYLDNLCDRVGINDESAFRQLHLAMLDAVDPDRQKENYYRFYPYKNDGGYLNTLVDQCRSQIAGMSSYELVIDTIKKYVHLYSDMQSYKHLSGKIRESSLKTWANYYMKRYPGISCWEFSAAAGSTLGIFVMFASAFNPGLTPEDVRALDSAYFPWICGLHILLDYFIDAHEDMQTGDLNFTYYYKNLKHCEERLMFFMERSQEHCSSLPYPGFHKTVLSGLAAMYLSDPKASHGMNRLVSKNILNCSLPHTITYYNICRFLRALEVL